MEFLSEKTPVAKKEHYCEFCGGKIHNGEKYIRQTNIDGGDFYDFKCHIHCKELADKLNMYDYDYGEGINGNVFEECICDYFNEKHYDDKEWKNKSIAELSKIAYEELGV